ncbi:hypothetical protein [Paenibacillus sp. FSL L8-0463]|uniref:hypothetical protein n=1 Tax=Paenibacillus sp. FSL L8-0463 TaxID=2954687 RepID=UPI00311A2B2F
MRLKRLLFYLILCSLLYLVGCDSESGNVGSIADSNSDQTLSSQTENKEVSRISLNDFSISRIGNDDEQIYYDMGRSEAEKILGQPSEMSTYDSAVLCTYNLGVDILYRNESVAGILLSAASEGEYQTQRGLSIGMQGTEVKGLFNQSPEQLISDSIVNYIYDSVLDDVLEGIPNPPRDTVFVYNIEIDYGTKKIRNIRLSDNQAIINAYQR